jgi:transcription termination factor Rho
MAHLDLAELKARPLPELVDLARSNKVDQPSGLTRQELIFELLRGTQSGQIVLGGGVLEVLPDGFGFLRDAAGNYLPGPDDIYVSPSQIRRFNLRNGDRVSGHVRPPKEGERYFALTRVEEVNSADPENSRDKALFDNLTPVHPHSKLNLDKSGSPLLRALDLLAPMALGQRGLLFGPQGPATTGLLCELAEVLADNHPELTVLVCLIDARPEQVTELSRKLRAEVLSSTFDEPPARHLQVAEMVVERARRLVEHGQDVVVFMDSITALVRASNQVTPPSGRQLVGGLDPGCLQRPKRLLGSARAAEEGGSLTLVATAIADSQSALACDILEALKGVANLEITLQPSGPLANIQALDWARTQTLRGDLIHGEADHAGAQTLRQSMSGDAAQDMALLTAGFSEHSSNRAWLDKLSETGH